MKEYPIAKMIKEGEKAPVGEYTPLVSQLRIPRKFFVELDDGADWEEYNAALDATRPQDPENYTKRMVLKVSSMDEEAAVRIVLDPSTRISINGAGILIDIPE